MPESFEQQTPIEDPAGKNKRMAEGNISQAEIEDYLRNPEGVLFEHTLVEKKGGKEVPIKVRCLTKEFMDKTLESLKDSWDEPTFENLKNTLEKHFEQKESGKPALLNAEYYIATDENDKPLGMTGLYTIDIQGGAGFATKDRLDTEKHHLNMGLGWYSVNKEAQGIGLGKYLLNWTENLAKSRDAHHFEIETDDWSNSKKALAMYKKSGYKLGYPVENFFGPGRDLNVYYLDCSEKEEQVPIKTFEITEENKGEVLQLAQENYSTEKFEEFKVCLDLFLSQDKESEAIFKGHSIVVKNQEGKCESFAIYVDGIYDNLFSVFWTGASDKSTKSKLLSALQSVAIENEKYVVTINTEGEDKDLDDKGFTRAEEGVPSAFEKGDPTRFLLLTKELK
jgi:GNAT superfamily N-acetyltransferase